MRYRTILIITRAMQAREDSHGTVKLKVLNVRKRTDNRFDYYHQESGKQFLRTESIFRILD